MSGKPWTDDDVLYLSEHYPHELTGTVADALGRNVSSVQAKATKLKLRKTPEFYKGYYAHRLDGTRGKDTRFKPGLKPWNKGKAYDSGGKSHETRFKPGNRPHTWQPTGTERKTGDGYTERKVTDTGNSRRDYVLTHRILWMEHNGPIPDGGVIVFRDKNPQNLIIENLELITRDELMRRNSIHNYPTEIVEAIRQVNGLRKRIKNIEKKRSAA